MTKDSAAIYFEGIYEDIPEELLDIRDEARASDVPIIRSSAGALLRFFIRTRKPDRILEIGSGTGYSALTMWEASGRSAQITTIEKYEKRIPKARENFEKYGAAESIELLEGDASDILKKLDGPYPFIFMDAAKGQYLNFLPDIMRLLSPGGMLVSDNILQDGDALRSRYAVRRRDRTIHARMREYLYELAHNEELETLFLEDGDGISVSIKKER
ncbi:MAG: O-methyltransferase [Lachnospiraceae bacterium]|nr:O-methyltransferase [Lachnospiraceae bacterium]